MPLIQRNYGQDDGGVDLFPAGTLHSLANNASIRYPGTGSYYNNEGGLLIADYELVVQFATAPLAFSYFSMWFIQSLDGGTTFEDGSTTLEPARGPDVIFPIRAVTTQQRVWRRVLLPAGIYFILLKNTNTGAALDASSAKNLKQRLASIQSISE